MPPARRLRLRLPGGLRSFRGQLILMTLVLLLPSLAFMGAVLADQARDSRARFEQQLLATTRAMSSSVDLRIAAAIAVNETLASSPYVETRDWSQLRRRTLPTLKSKSEWIVLSDPDGRQVMNTRVPEGRELKAPAPQPENIRLAAASGRSRVSNLVRARIDTTPAVAVDTPVMVGGAAYDLGYLMDVTVFLRLLQEQRVQPPRIAVLLDRDARIVARTLDHAHSVGKLATVEFRRDALPQEGVMESHSLEGSPTLLAYRRSAVTGWTVVLAVPRSELDAALPRALIQAAVLSVLLLALGASMSWLLSHRLHRKVRALGEDAAALGRGAAVPVRKHGMDELAAIQSALSVASEQLERRERRHELMVNELNHRVKNTLATVQALARQSFAEGRSSREALDSLNGRLFALARAHDLLTTAGWDRAELTGVLERCAGPSLSRFALEGPATALGPQMSVGLCMIVHELMTNSLKYGALSADDGRIEIRWTTLGDRLHLVWSETGGPPVDPPSRQGFGSVLIGRLAKHEMSGTVDHDYRPEGLVFTADLVLEVEDRWTSQFN